MTEHFREFLLAWYDRARRDLPWRRTTDPYAIWVSEVMLQQTRVAAVIPYYTRFLERFPTVQHLAAAEEPDLLGAWAGLGYYSRARNMQAAARQMNGKVPSTFEALRDLPGFGPYTSAAVASIAFGLPHTAVDGNVLRVVARVTNNAGDISTPRVRTELTEMASALLDRSRPGDFNQAMMELGATVCLPKQPQCLICPVASVCEARAAGTQSDLPVTGKRAPVVRVTRRLFIAEQDGAILFWQRAADSRKLAGFWELPEAEQLAHVPDAELIGTFRHSITNHQYKFEVARISSRLSVTCKQVVNCAWIARKALENMALSTTARKALALLSEHHP